MLNYSVAELRINKDKRDEKASFICFFAPFAFINFFLDNLLKFIVNLQPVIKINKLSNKNH